MIFPSPIVGLPTPISILNQTLYPLDLQPQLRSIDHHGMGRLGVSLPRETVISSRLFESPQDVVEGMFGFLNKIASNLVGNSVAKMNTVDEKSCTS